MYLLVYKEKDTRRNVKNTRKQCMFYGFHCQILTCCFSLFRDKRPIMDVGVLFGCELTICSHASFDAMKFANDMYLAYRSHFISDFDNLTLGFKSNLADWVSTQMFVSSGEHTSNPLLVDAVYHCIIR